MNASSRRLYLRVATKLLFAVAAVAVGSLFLGYLVSGADRGSSRDDVWTRPIDIRGIGEGELELFDWPGGTIGVYRRTAAQIRALEALAEPESERTREPVAARPPDRSLSPEHFVFMARTPGRGCRVRLAERSPPGDAPWHGGFHDPCTGTWFDLAGRPYAGDGEAPGNLVVPAYRYVGEGRIRLQPPR